MKNRDGSDSFVKVHPRNLVHEKQHEKRWGKMSRCQADYIMKNEGDFNILMVGYGYVLILYARWFQTFLFVKIGTIQIL